MSQVECLADQLERAFRGGAWHGPAVAETLAGIDETTAAARPCAGAHSIWEIVHHLIVWNDVPRRRLDGERLQNLPIEADWPPVKDVSADAWRAALAALEEAHAGFHARVLKLTEGELDNPVTGSDSTVRSTIFGVLQHNAYHAGQIILLSKRQEGES